MEVYTKEIDVFAEKYMIVDLIFRLLFTASMIIWKDYTTDLPSKHVYAWLIITGMFLGWGRYAYMQIIILISFLLVVVGIVILCMPIILPCMCICYHIEQ